MTSPNPTAGRYQLQARIGQGATGVVYEAIDPDRARHVAVKVMLPDVAQDAASREHFLREARAVSRLSHRHLATVYEVAGSDEPAFVAMERLRGRTLAERLTASPAPTLAESLEIVEQLCLGLQFAHEHGLVHRNVTPANIWLLEDGSVKLVDFGLPPASAPTVRDSRALIRRVAYLSPEQIAAKPVDGRADIFAAGVVLFELVTGRRPFEADSVTGIFDKVVNASADHVQALVPAEAGRVDEVLGRALAKDPGQRYPDALEMAADLTLTRLELIGSSRPHVVAEAPAVAPLPAVEERAFVGYPGAEAPGPRAEAPESRADAPASRAEAPGPRAEAAGAWAEAPGTWTGTPEPPQSPQWDLPSEAWDSTPLPQGLGAANVPESWQTGDALGYNAATAPTLFARLRATIEAQSPIALVAVGAAVALAVLVGVWLAVRTPTPLPVTGGGGASANRGKPPVAGVAVAQMRIESSPADAEVFLNGASLGTRTPADIPAERLRNAELRLVKPGYAPLAVRLTPADIAKKTMSFPLVAEAALITVSASAPFEFEVLSGRTVVSRAATSHRFTVRGEQTLRVRAPDYYLDRAVTIPAGKPAVTLSVPALGRLSVRVSPALERCRVSVGGRDFGTPPFPPVPYQAIVAGNHRVELKCEDEAVIQQIVTVEAARDRAAIFR
jgi:Protein kinase domain/PEGA domain